MVIFYEKPGCMNNARQKLLLKAAGHEVEARDILTEAWTAELLARFFEGMSMEEWFNPSAPRIKSGEVNPQQLNEEQALEAMVDDPLLIRRPLMEVNGSCKAGFVYEEIHAWIGLGYQAQGKVDLEKCMHTEDQPCVVPVASL